MSKEEKIEKQSTEDKPKIVLPQENSTAAKNHFSISIHIPSE